MRLGLEAEDRDEIFVPQVNVPVLFTHHSRQIDPHTGRVQGAISDLQAAMVCEIVTGAGQPIDYRSFPQMGHFMHSQDPDLFCRTVIDWHDNLQLDQ